MMWALRRRIQIIGIIVTAILVLIVFPYWLTHREIPTCFDGKQNQEEAGVDCGSPCMLVCKGAAKDFTILWTKVFPIRSGEYDVVSYVENPNFNIGAPTFTYTATLYDDAGAVIATKQGKDFARPSERFVIFAGKMLTGEKIAKTGSITIHPDFQWITTPKSPPLFSVIDKSLTGADQKPRLTALIHNETTDLYRNIDVSAVIYDSDNTPIGVSSTKVDKLDPNGNENLIFTWPRGFTYTAETEQCDTPIDVMLLLDRSGSMASEGKNPPQPFGRVRDATSMFVNFLTPKDQVGVLSFSTNASNPVEQMLTSDFPRAKNRIENVQMGTNGIQYTNTGEAIVRMVGEFASQRHDPSVRAIAILLTDGESLEPNRPQNPNDPKDMNYPRQYALDQAADAKRQGISIYTIGLGVNANDEFLKLISTTPDQYYPSPSAADLNGVYQKIASAICKKNPSVIEIIPRVNNVLTVTQVP